MKFSEVIGHKDLADKLSALIAAQRLPHAMLLLGPEGSGGLTVALALAQNLVCERRSGRIPVEAGPSLFGDTPIAIEQPTLHDACGECSACMKASKCIHPDIHFTFPVYRRTPTKPALSNDFITEWRTALAETPYMNSFQWLQSAGAENQQGNITIDECHHIIHNLNLTTYEAACKVQIIWMAEYLREQANSLLKMIEEPPANTYFILIAENADLILPTILSRTQIFKLSSITDEDLIAYLHTRYEMTDTEARRAARIAHGNILVAQEYANGGGHSFEQLLQSWLSICLRLNTNSAGDSTAKLLPLIDEIAELKREKQKIFIQYFLWFLQEVTPLLYGLPADKLEDSELTFARKFVTLMDITSIDQLQTILSSLHYHIERNGNPKILFTAASMKIESILRKEPVIEEW